MGIQWSLGHFELTTPGKPHPFFLPGLFSAAGIFYKIFGIHDFTFKLLNLASLAGIFIFLRLIAREMGLRFPYSLFPAAIFLLLPSVITQSRVELAHLLSTFFVLASLFLLNQFRKSRKILALAGSAAVLHAAMTTHCDLALLAPGYLTILLMDRREGEKSLRGIFRETAVFSVVFFLPFFFYFRIWGYEQIMAAIHDIRLHPVVVPGKHFPMLTLEFLSVGLPMLLGKPLMWILAGGLAASLWRGSRGKERPYDALVLMPAVSYFLLFELLIRRNRLELLLRVLIPILPFFCLYLASRIQFWCGRSQGWRGAAASFFLAAILFINYREFSQVPSFAFYSPRSRLPFYQYQTVHRHVYEKLKDRLSVGEKVLLAPSQLLNNHDAFNLPFYFNGRAVALRACRGSKASFEDFLKRERIRFVFVGTERFFDAAWLEERTPPGESYCLASSDPYDPRAETLRLREALEAFSPVEIYRSDYYGTIYEIRPP